MGVPPQKKLTNKVVSFVVGGCCGWAHAGGGADGQIGEPTVSPVHVLLFFVCLLKSRNVTGVLEFGVFFVFTFLKVQKCTTSYMFFDDV